MANYNYDDTFIYTTIYKLIKVRSYILVRLFKNYYYARNILRIMNEKLARIDENMKKISILKISAGIVRPRNSGNGSSQRSAALAFV